MKIHAPLVLFCPSNLDQTDITSIETQKEKTQLTKVLTRGYDSAITTMGLLTEPLNI